MVQENVEQDFVVAKVEKYCGISVGDTIIPIIGTYNDMLCLVKEIRIDEGARNGWFTVVTDSGVKLLLAGEEIAKLRSGVLG